VPSRAEIRAWLEANCPASVRGPAPAERDVWGGSRETFADPDAKLWFERMRAQRWIAPTWPAAYGGADMSADDAAVLDQELTRIGARPPLKSFGLWMLGPVLLDFGDDDHKRTHLPRIARGEVRWCQGYSEPGAGSDLASLACRAERRGDSYVVTGQKIWTSHADKADWMFCLVRTDPTAPKHEGISFLLIDMRSPGVSVRPIELISGASVFCETFFDAVEVPAANLVGGANRGWSIAKALLGHERQLISKLRNEAPEDTEPLHATAMRYGVVDPVLRDRVTQVELDRLCQRLTLQRAAEARAAGRRPGAETSMFKLYGTELNQRSKALRVELAGYRGLGWEGPGFDAEELGFTREWLRSRANTIEGGTSEIQRNIIARRVLELPDEPKG
jgi:alkylation response protein AidB-like acyl-CoA dehydrogenase